MGVPSRASPVAGGGLVGEPQAGAATVAEFSQSAAAHAQASPARRVNRPAQRLRAERPNHVWAFDFQFDQTADGQALKLCNIVDEFTREALVMLVARGIDADRTVSEVERLVAERGVAQEQLRMDNGTEMTANALKDWCRFSKTGRRTSSPLAVAEPVLESFHSRVRDELFDVEEFSCLAEARVVIEDWREDYNRHRPHSSLGMRAPAVFAAEWTPSEPAMAA